MSYILFLALIFLPSFMWGASHKQTRQTVEDITSEVKINLPHWVDKWLKILNLEEWKVEAKIVPVSDLKPDTLGNLKWNSISHTATIKVLRPQDYDPGSKDISRDIEFTVLHELVHLQLSVLPRDMSRKDIEENVVNNFAQALMNLEAKKDGGTQAAVTIKPPSPQGNNGENGRGK